MVYAIVEKPKKRDKYFKLEIIDRAISIKASLTEKELLALNNSIRWAIANSSDKIVKE